MPTMTATTDIAMALTRSDHELSLDEALLLLAVPERDHAAGPSEPARSPSGRALSETACRRCHYDTEPDGFCVMCGEVTL